MSIPDFLLGFELGIIAAMAAMWLGSWVARRSPHP